MGPIMADIGESVTLLLVKSSCARARALHGMSLLSPLPRASGDGG